MEQYNISKGTSFYAIGLSYKKADAEIRARMMLYYQVAEQGIFLSDSKEKRKKLLKQRFIFLTRE